LAIVAVIHEIVWVCAANVAVIGINADISNRCNDSEKGEIDRYLSKEDRLTC
jgi:hypothetical protein